jgi:hypothetical protein
MLSWLHTVDMDNLPLDFGGAKGKGGILGGEGEMNDPAWSCSTVMLPPSEVVGSGVTLARMGW